VSEKVTSEKHASRPREEIVFLELRGSRMQQRSRMLKEAIGP
jgi:hypothetical protein